MTAENLIKELERYRAELANIMKRFTDTKSGRHMNSEDDPRLRTFVIELVDLLDDSLGENQYSPLIQATYNSGYSQYYLSYSYKCVEDIISVLDSVITRLKRNPELCNPKQKVTPSSSKPLQYPDKLTLKWLWDHVPYSFWAILFGLLFSAFTLGITFAQTMMYKSLINLIKPNNNTNITTQQNNN